MADADGTDASLPATPGGADAGPAADATRAAEVAPAADATPADDAKAKFRAALERKKAASHRTAQGSGNTGAVHGAGNTGPSQRTFRRRSGSS